MGLAAYQCIHLITGQLRLSQMLNGFMRQELSGRPEYRTPHNIILEEADPGLHKHFVVIRMLHMKLASFSVIAVIKHQSVVSGISYVRKT